jgi:ketosteroid isomerase-like protein
MTPGSTEFVRARWAAIAGGDHEALVAACDRAVVWDLTRLDGWTDEPIHHGHDGVRAVLRELSWAEGGTCIAFGPRVLIDSHDDATSAIVHELSDGRIVRMASITDLREGQLALAGGPDPVAVVLSVWAAWEARDMDRVMACFADDVVFDLTQYEAWCGSPQYDGPTSMISFLAEWMAWWHGYHQTLLAYEAHGGDVLLTVDHAGTRDGAYVDEIGGLIYAVRPDGVIDRWTGFSSPEKARAWIQLRQAPAEAQ